MFRNVLLILAIAAVAAGGAYLWLGGPTEVTIAQATRGKAAEIVYATGEVEPEFWAKVTPIQRGRIVESCRCEGKEVSKGDLLFRLEDGQARAKVAEIAARSSLSDKELLRAADLFARGVATRERMDQAKAAATELRAALASAEGELGHRRILSPMSGQVLRIEGEVGEVAELGAALAWVGKPRPLLVVVEVNEEDIPRVRPGQAVLLGSDAFPNRKLKARVRSITPMGDPTLQTYRVRLELARRSPLLIGMTVDVNIIVRTVEDAVLVPAKALIDGHVQLIDDQGIVELRKVAIGIRGVRSVQIVKGLMPGARVIAPALDGIEPGDRVKAASAP